MISESENGLALEEKKIEYDAGFNEKIMNNHYLVF